MHSPEELLRKMAQEGGFIVCTDMCTEIEIAHARAENRMAVDADGIGYVLRPVKVFERLQSRGCELVAAVARIPESPYQAKADELAVALSNKLDMLTGPK